MARCRMRVLPCNVCKLASAMTWGTRHSMRGHDMRGHALHSNQGARQTMHAWTAEPTGTSQSVVAQWVFIIVARKKRCTEGKDVKKGGVCGAGRGASIESRTWLQFLLRIALIWAAVRLCCRIVAPRRQWPALSQHPAGTPYPAPYLLGEGQPATPKHDSCHLHGLRW